MKVITAKTDKDIETCYNLREIIFIQGQNVPVDRERDKEDATAVHFLVIDNNIPIGVGRIVVDNDTAIVGRVGVLNEYRGKGIGLYLMKKIIDYCKKQNFQKLTLGAQEHALNFYKKLNFEVCSEKYMDASIPHYKMQLLLS